MYSGVFFVDSSLIIDLCQGTGVRDSHSAILETPPSPFTKAQVNLAVSYQTLNVLIIWYIRSTNLLE